MLRVLLVIRSLGLLHFLPGHSSQDLYILCHASEITPPASLRDVKDGGCVMTCAAFEKRAGRELSKKWKESIHVLGHDGSRATLITWLRRQASRWYGDQVIGKTCWIRWFSDGEVRKSGFLEFILPGSMMWYVWSGEAHN
jgi:hypothetical protein